MVKKLQSKTFKGHWLIALLLSSVAMWSQTTVTKTFNTYGFSNGQELPSGQIDDNISFTTQKNGSGTTPAYYTTGTNVRLYSGSGNGGSITLTPASGFVITSVVFNGVSGNTANADYSIDNGTNVAISASGNNYTISNISAVSGLRLRHTASSGQIRLTGVTVTYMQNNTTATPAISATGVSNGTDTFWQTATVSITSATENATTYYTTDGTEPTTASAVYTAPFAVNNTTTVKAFSTTTGLENSAVATKTFTITTPATASLPYSEAFNNSLGTWRSYAVTGNKPWLANSNGASADGYNINPSVESWLISPKFTGVTGNFAISFNYSLQFGGQPLQVVYSTNYDGYSTPSTATWVSLTSISGNTTGTGSTGNITVPVNANVHVALKYTGSLGNYSSWYVNNFSANVAPPVVTTTQVVTDNSTITTATSGGTITFANGTVSQKGVVWDTAQNPTIALPTKTEQGAGSGTTPDAFNSNITGLAPNTLYYYRAYAVNEHGTGYGTGYSFTTRAYTPGAPVVTAPNSTTLTVAIDENGNNATTKYSIRVNGGIYTNGYVQANGSISTTEVFQTTAEWGAKIVEGLATTTTYTFNSRARNNATALTNWSADATGTTTESTVPALVLSTSALDFGDVCLNTYNTGSFSFTGQTLVQPATLLVSAITGYSFSLTETGTYTDTVTIENFDGNEITVWVRFTPVTAQSYTTEIQVDGQGDNVTAILDVNTTGNGINTPGTATTNAVTTDITQTSAVLYGSGTIACSAITEYGFIYSTTSGFTTGTTIVASNISSGNFSAAVSNLAPATTYYYKAYITDGAGTQYGSQLSFTTTLLAAPLTVTATDITQTSFTANWTAVTGTEEYRLDVSPYENFGTGTLATDLFFSEYIEGSGNNKFLEIYNGTGHAVDLSDYRLRAYFNGGADVPAVDTFYNVQLSGILQPFTTVVYKGSGVNINVPSAITNSAVNFNGNDPLELFKISTNSVVDIFGRIGENPGTAWTSGSGQTQLTTVNKTLRRKASVTGGVTTNPTTGFPTLATEWEVYDIDDVSGLGTHNFNFTPAYVPGYENLPVTGTSQVVSGLTDTTTYYYKVRAYSSAQTSEDSNVTSVITLLGTVRWEIPNGATTASWTPNLVPNETLDVVISADYNTATDGAFTAKNVTLNSGYKLTVASGTTATVYGNITNNATVTNFVVENNASLLQTGNGTNTGAITVKRDSNPLRRLDYTMWSSPVNGTQTMADFSPETTATRFYEYRYGIHEGAEMEAYFHVATTDTFTPAHSYLIRMPSSLSTPGYQDGTAQVTFTGLFTGTPNNGTYTRELNTQGSLYTSTGNPYPSPISVYDFFMDNSNALSPLSGIYLWRKRNNSEAPSYAVLSLAGLTVNSGSEEGGQGLEQYYASVNENDNQLWTLAPGQGFIVRTNDNATAPQLTYTNSMRRAANVNGHAFFRNAQASEANTTSRYWLNLTAEDATGTQTLVAYKEGATTGIDFGYDAKRFADGNLSVYSIEGGHELNIQARPGFEATDSVTLGYNAPSAGTYSISLNSKDGVFENGQDIYLVDSAEGIIYNLNNGAYSFTTAAGTFNGRFQVIYINSTLETTIPVLNTNAVAIYKSGNNINITTGIALIQNVAIYDIRGRQLATVANINATETTINNLTAEQQVLIVQIATDKGTISKKIVF